MSTHAPVNRQEFKALILRRLGAPVLRVNVTDDQIEDCVEEALKYFRDYHYDGTEHIYYSHVITETDKTNGWIEIPEDIIGISEVYSLSSQSFQIYAAEMFSGGYQMAFDFVFNQASGGLVSYYLNRTAYEFMNQMITGIQAIRFNRHTNRLSLDVKWNRIGAGSAVVIDGQKIVTSPDIWNDRWLAKYATEKVKYIWGSNMSKFEGMQLPGGVTLNGNKIQDDAAAAIQALEDEMMTNYSLPPRDMIG